MFFGAQADRLRLAQDEGFFTLGTIGYSADAIPASFRGGASFFDGASFRDGESFGGSGLASSLAPCFADS